MGRGLMLNLKNQRAMKPKRKNPHTGKFQPLSLHSILEDGRVLNMSWDDSRGGGIIDVTEDDIVIRTGENQYIMLEPDPMGEYFVKMRRV